MSTVQKLVTKIYERLSLGAGLDVQTYADSKVLIMLQHKFDVLFDAFYWPAYLTVGEPLTLDGITGRVTNDISTLIKRWEDIHSIYYESDVDKLPNASLGVNPRLIQRRCVFPDASKIFRIAPFTLTGTVYVTYRTKPDDLELDDTVDVKLDDELLILGCCYDFIVDDDSNDRAAANFKQQFDARYSQIKNLQNQFGFDKTSATLSNTMMSWSDA